MTLSTPVPIFAVTTRGLESLCAAEMARLPGLRVLGSTYRRVSAEYSGSLSRLLTLRTVDDVFLTLAAWHEISAHRAALPVLKELSSALPLKAALAAVSSTRSINRPVSFSVTANFVGRRNYTADEIKAAAAEGVMAAVQWTYASEDESQLNLRIFIEHDQAYVGLRVGEYALHRRLYKQSHVTGSLKPPVAAAMLEVAGELVGENLLPNRLLLDPFCGAGTILIEAALQGANPLGGDLSPQALQAARENAARASASLSLCRWDAAYLPLAKASVSTLVTNLPWGRQVVVDDDLGAFYAAISAELGRVLAAGGCAVLLTNLPDLLRLGPPARTVEISLFGQTPSILGYRKTI